MDEILTTGFSKNKVYISSTSGSSGHPFFFAKDKFTHALTWANIEQRYKSIGINIGDSEARFYGIPKEPKYYYFEKCKDFILNRYRFSIFDLSDKICESYLGIFNKFSFKHKSLVIFDQFNPSFYKYFSRNELIGVLEKKGFKVESLVNTVGHQYTVVCSKKS